MTSPVSLVIARLLQAPAVAELVDVHAGRQAVMPVILDPSFGGCGIAVSRLYDERDEGNIQAVVAVTCLAASYAKVEELGEAVVGTLRDDIEKPWSHGDVDDVQFEKMGPDVTGWDPGRRQYFRSIEFAVNW